MRRVEWLVLCAACGGNDSTPPQPPSVPLGSATPVGARVNDAAPVPATQKPTESFEPCAAQMFDHEPGHHDRFVFEADDGKQGYRDADDNVVIPARFGFAYEFSEEGVAATAGEDGAFFIDPKGRTLARAFFFDNGPDYFQEKRARITDDTKTKVGFIADDGHIVLAPTYDHATPFCNGMAAVCDGCSRRPGEHGDMLGGKWGFVDRGGRLVIALQYDAVHGPFDPDTTEVVFGGQTITIDRTGTAVSPRAAPP